MSRPPNVSTQQAKRVKRGLAGHDTEERRFVRFAALALMGVKPPRRGEPSGTLSKALPWVEHLFGEFPADKDARIARVEELNHDKNFRRAKRQELFLQGIIYYYTPAAACLHAAVSWQTVLGWMSTDDEYRKWIDAAREMAVQLVETGLFNNARDGKTDSYVFLQARMNDVYRYQGKGDSHSGAIQVVIVNQLPDGTLQPNQSARVIEARSVEAMTVQALPERGSGDGD